jgi:hypothetical protein
MSAFGGQADIGLTRLNVRLWPRADIDGNVLRRHRQHNFRPQLRYNPTCSAQTLGGIEVRARMARI